MSLASLGKWLASRFPEKLEVTLEEFEDQKTLIKGAHLELSDLTSRLGDISARLDQAERRISSMEINAASVQAMKELIKHVEDIKAEVNKIKFSMGMDRAVNPEIAAMLNGEPVGE